jgi:hypothetical protein
MRTSATADSTQLTDTRTRTPQLPLRLLQSHAGVSAPAALWRSVLRRGHAAATVSRSRSHKDRSVVEYNPPPTTQPPNISDCMAGFGSEST